VRDRPREAHLRRLGTRDPRCTYPGCEEREPSAFNGVHPHIVCHEHDLGRRGFSEWEGQHPSGAANDEATFPIRGNDHRVWDDAKRDWPTRTLRNPDGSPLLRAADAIRGLLDWALFVAQRLIGWIPPLLERLDEQLRAIYGDAWWVRLGLDLS
jgi:hypothetical protein